MNYYKKIEEVLSGASRAYKDIYRKSIDQEAIGHKMSDNDDAEEHAEKVVYPIRKKLDKLRSLVPQSKKRIRARNTGQYFDIDSKRFLKRLGKKGVE